MRLSPGGLVTIALLAPVTVCCPLRVAAQNVAARGLERELSEYLRPYAESHIFSGAVLVAKGGTILLRKGYGMADLTSGVPNTPETIFHVGQLTEGFTAAAILLLAERGQLSVNDTLSKFIPWFPDANHSTLRALLTHSSGLASPPTLQDFESRSRIQQSLGATVRWLATNPARIPRRPGSYEYSSADYILLAYVIEQASAQSYDVFLQHNILDPLGMRSTSLGGGSKSETTATRYVAYGPRFAEPAPPLDWSILVGSSSAHTTVDDLFAWDRALRSERILNESSRRQMFTAQRGDQGYGWLIRDGGRSITINIRAPGLGAGIERFPDEDICVIVLSNVMESLSHSIADDLAAIARGQPIVPAAPPKPAIVDEQLLNDYIGRYEFRGAFFSPVKIVEVVRKGDGLAILSDGFPASDYLVARGDAAFVDRLYGGTVEFSRDGNGAVNGLLWKLSTSYRARRSD